ncbi:MAG: 3-phosphoshikimate 1-carboxyvinyltransferase [Sphaerochaeta sp.]
MTVTITPSSLCGEMDVPGSKSATIRAVLLSTLSKGRSVIHNPLSSGDGVSAKEAARALGATIVDEGATWIVDGVGENLTVPAKELDLGNSGTATSFFTSIAALAQKSITLTGDAQIQSRPFNTLFDALKDLGVEVLVHNANGVSPPVTVTGPLKGGAVTLEGFNSQFISSLLLVAPFAEQPVTITVQNGLEKPYIQLTLDWMKRYGVEVANPSDYEYFEVANTKHYRSQEVTVPGDWSAVAFPLVAAAITNSTLTITGLDFSDSQGDKAVVDLLIQMGADIRRNEEEGSLTIIGGSELTALGEIDLGAIPDALPALAVAATQAHGKTTFTNIAHVRVKESDRVLEMADRLERLGCKTTMTADTFTIEGPAMIHGGVVTSAGDHRIAMAMVALACAAQEPITITDCECIDVSFPGFFERFEHVGVEIKKEAAH